MLYLNQLKKPKYKTDDDIHASISNKILQQKLSNLVKGNPHTHAKSNKLKVCCITWNMHGLNPNQNEINSLLGPHKDFDIYAIGSEECLRSIFKSLFYSDKTTWD